MASEAPFADLDRIVHDAAAMIRPPPIRDAAAWADASRILPASAAEPGRWRTDRVPYTAAIYQAFSDPGVEIVVAVMASQMSKSEIVLNVIGHRFTDGPFCPAMYVGPTEKQARSFARDRLAGLLRSTKTLRDRTAKGQQDRIGEKYIAGMRLGIAWAGSATELASHPVGLAFIDEVDRMAESTGTEGDPVELVRARQATYPERKLGIFSTPTVRGASRIMALWQSGSMLAWCWPCRHCGAWFRPQAKLLSWNREAKGEAIEQSARIACEHCGGSHDDIERREINRAGKYLPMSLDDQGSIAIADCEPPPNRIASFMVSGLASPWQSLGALAMRLSAAYESQEQSTLQAVTNTAFGEPFEVAGDAPTLEAVRFTLSSVERTQPPAWSTLVTLGADVQRDGLWYCIRAFGFDPDLKAERSCSIDHGFIAGDPEFDDIWAALGAVITRPYHDPIGNRALRLELALIDSGYNPSTDRYRRPEHVVYEACRRLSWRALPSKGHATLRAPTQLSKAESLPSGRKIHGLRIWHIDTDYFKSKIHSLIRLAADPGGARWQLHREADDDYLRQLTAEELHVYVSGRRVWKRRGRQPNHLFDCEVLAAAAAYIHRTKLINPAPTPGGSPPAPGAPPAEPAPREEPRYLVQRKNWIPKKK